MLEVIRKIAQAKKYAKKACNQIAAYEIDQQIRKFTDELVALYEQMEQQSNSTEDNFYKLKKDTALAVKKVCQNLMYKSSDDRSSKNILREWLQPFYKK